ncbi:MAG TPA: BON domain-containing protein [Verrucomicrobiae bacterium]|nr:BON domain-containing protein [Verrucomicrobiae bacterium]
MNRRNRARAREVTRRRTAFGHYSGVLNGSWYTALFIALTLQAVALQPTRAAIPSNSVLDHKITTAVEDELLFEKSVSPNFIDVTTDKGIVTLTGTVNDILAKDRAVKIAETIRGVRAVVNRIEVRPTARPDQDIRKGVLAVLSRDPATEGYQIAVSVTNAVVTLTGTVGSWAEVRLAGEVAKGVTGVKELSNDLKMHYAVERPDSAIAADVKARLRWDVWLNNDSINAIVQDGKVTLTGTVGSVLEKSRATGDAWVDGVFSVDATELNVEPWARERWRRQKKFSPTPDSDIKKAVALAFHYDPRVAAFSPDVRVEDGAVILSGVVGDLKAKISAAQDARDVVGVVSVDNLLKVRRNALPSDAAASQDLKAALLWDPTLDGTSIESTVIHHVAYLSGLVDSGLQRQEAQDLAERTKGVVEVHNHLEVEPTYPIPPLRWPDFEDRYNWPFGWSQIPPPPLKSDAQIRKDIEKAFFWSPFVDRDDIQLRVRDGVATLTGTVEGWVAVKEAQRDAYKGGASFVINRLHVRKGTWF